MTDFESTRTLLRSLGLVEVETRNDPQVFGSWVITAKAQGEPIRVIWDGRDGMLIIQEPSPSSSGDWVDRWIAGANYQNNPDDLTSSLISILKT